MRPIGIGLIAALALAVMAPATAANAAPKKDPRAALMAAKNKEKGMAEAPALAQAAGLTCKVVDARWMGEDKPQALNIYEVACEQGLGFVLFAKAGEPQATIYSCIETMEPNPDGTPHNARCELPANANPIAGLAPYITKAGRACAVEKARGLGRGQKNAYFEVLCQGDMGYILVTSSPPSLDDAVQMNTCVIYAEDNPLFCKLVERSAQFASVDALVAKSGKNCTVKDRRYVLSTKTNSNYYEVACTSGVGYMLEENAKGDLARILDCSVADFVDGGCTLSDARLAKTEQAALYSRLAKNAGFNCDVAKYAPLTTVGAKEVIEMQCSNRPDGGIGVFSGSGGHVYNCVLADAHGYRCSFTGKELVYSKFSTDLDKFGKESCEVSETRGMGKTATDVLVEVACADGLRGWVMSYPNESSTAKDVISCRQAESFGNGGCRLASNRRGD